MPPPPSSGRRRALLASLYFVAMAVAVTFPGVIPFNRIRPFVLGVPFVLVWYLAWVTGALLVFLALYRTEDP